MDDPKTLSQALLERERKLLEQRRKMMKDKVIGPLVKQMIEDGVLPEPEGPVEITFNPDTPS